MSRAVLREPVARSFAEVLLADVGGAEHRVRNLSKTERGLATLKEEARQEGFNHGYSQGLEQGRADGFEQGRLDFEQSHAQKLASFATELADLQVIVLQTVQSWLESSEDRLAELAVLIATRIIGSELATDPETVAKITKSVLAEVTHADRAVVRVNPFDNNLLSERQHELLAAIPALKHIEILADQNVGVGCVVETDGGVIDGTVETQIHAALQAIRGETA